MKAKFFVGGRGSGKNRTANMIAEYVGREKTAILPGRGFNNHPFLFSKIKEDTQLIIIDDCPDDMDVIIHMIIFTELVKSLNIFSVVQLIESKHYSTLKAKGGIAIVKFL